MYKSCLYQILFTVVLVLLSFSARAETVYVSDELTTALRSGGTSSHRIIKFLPSGTRLTVIEADEDAAFTKVSTKEGKEGWVEAKHLMNNRSARDQLPGLQTKTKELRGIVKELKEKKFLLEQKINKIEADNLALTGRIKELRAVAADPIATADKNRRLTNQLEKADAKNLKLTEDNDRLSNMDIKLWFIIGGGVALLSVILGLVIPSFNWGRKKDSWGGGF